MSSKELELPQELSRVHHTFHVSNLKKCYADEPLVMPLEGIHVDDKLQFVEEPVEIMEREIKRLKRSRIPLVKVRWNSRRGPEFTWEREDSFKQKYPQLFTNRASSSTTRELPAKVNKARVTMSSATSDVTYTSVYSDSDLKGLFWEPIMRRKSTDTIAIPQKEDGARQPMFIQAHDPNYVPEPIYPEYIPLEDDHEFPAEEQPLPPIDSPTTESPGYVTESDPEEDPEEYEDDETEDGPVDYPMDGGDDDDGDSSRDDARDEDEDEEDEEDEEEEEHLAPADSTTVIPADKPVLPPEGTEPVIPPPSTDITIGARITVRPQASISLPPEAEVERLLTMTTPSPSPPISLSPPSAGERLARYGIGDVSGLARPARGQGISFGFISTVRSEERSNRGLVDVGYGIRDTLGNPAEAVSKIAPMTDLIPIRGFCSGCDSSTSSTHRNLVYAMRPSTRHSQTSTGCRILIISDTAPAPDQMVEALRVIRDMRREMSDMQTELLALREPQGRARQPGPEARIPDHQEASGDADSHI
ncbi:hypothetical protein Tco_1402277 [Tanacetum coccineum]